MRLDVLDAWLAALRSGEFPKGAGRLALRRVGDTSVTYCCLGVLCELARRDRIPLEVVELPDVNRSTVVTFDGDRNYLPVAVQRWAELDDKDPIVGDERLSSLNDRSSTFYPVIYVLERWRWKST